MKYKYFLFASICLVMIFGITSLAYMIQGQTEKLRLVLESSKQNYLLGEVVSLKLTATNVSNETIVVNGNLDPESGDLNIQVSKDLLNFKQRQGGTKRIDSSGSTFNLTPGDRVGRTANLLWNAKPPEIDRSTTAPETIAAVTKTRILTDYVFPEAGIYYIKATCFIYDSESDRMVKIESEPIQIVIDGPVGEDKVFWEKIKNNGDLGYFIEYGKANPGKSFEEQKAIHDEMVQLLEDHPNSRYSESLRKNIEKSSNRMEERKKFLEKLNRQQP
jgi:hypothetical protein